MQCKTANALIIYTGGTIGMKVTPEGLKPAKHYLKKKLSKLPQFHDPEQNALTTPVSRFGKRIHYDVIEWDELIDSSNMNLHHWIKLVQDIEENYDKYDAFIVIHGTDTMAYTASALSFMIENLTKPVFLTGSQVPIAIEPNDAVHNLLSALTIAGHFNIPEVCIYFDHKLLRGNRSRKIDALGFDAYNSHNYSHLVKVGTDIEISWTNVRNPPSKPPKFHKEMNPNVGVMKLFPGLSASVLKNYLQEPLQGCILETYGTGNAPDNRPDFLEVLKEATDRGVIIVNVSQCMKGSVNDDTYATGRALSKAGVISGLDMTTEAALTKLTYLLARQDFSGPKVKELIRKNLRGELTQQNPNKAARYTFADENFLAIVAKALTERESSEDYETVFGDTKTAFSPLVMCAAAHQGNLGIIQSLVEAGADPSGTDYDKRSALHIAASEGNFDIVKYLVDQGAKVSGKDRYGSTPIDCALNAGQEAVAQFLKEVSVLQAQAPV